MPSNAFSISSGVIPLLVSMLQQDKIHPLLAFSHCGMFSDAESAYAMSMEYYQEQEAKYHP